MYEFHGWIVIREKVNEVNTGNLFSISNTIKYQIEELDCGSSKVLDIKIINGAVHLYTTGLSNHKALDGDDIITLYENVAKIAPGSYGLLYIRDDEDCTGFENKFRVIVLKRGQLIEKEDMLLSPCNPTIEE